MFILTSFFLREKKKQRADRRESMNTFENNELVNKIAAACLPQAGKIYRNGSASQYEM